MIKKSAYHIDSSQISLQQLKTHLLGRELIPSRKPLKVNLEGNLAALEQMGISSVDELLSSLKNKNKLKEVSQKTGIEEGYLTLLRREANSYFPAPVALHKFPGISKETVQHLADHGVKNSKQFFEWIHEEKGLSRLAAETGIALEILTRLAGLADLARAFGVGPVFADLLYNAGIHSLEEFLSYSPEQIVELYQQSTGKKADFSLGDLKFSQIVAAFLFSS